MTLFYSQSSFAHSFLTQSLGQAFFSGVCLVLCDWSEVLWACFFLKTGAVSSTPFLEAGGSPSKHEPFGGAVVRGSQKAHPSIWLFQALIKISECRFQRKKPVLLLVQLWEGFPRSSAPCISLDYRGRARKRTLGNYVTESRLFSFGSSMLGPLQLLEESRMLCLHSFQKAMT